jgi:hypothetical protein
MTFIQCSIYFKGKYNDLQLFHHWNNIYHNEYKPSLAMWKTVEEVPIKLKEIDDLPALQNFIQKNPHPGLLLVNPANKVNLIHSMRSYPCKLVDCSANRHNFSSQCLLYEHP